MNGIKGFYDLLQKAPERELSEFYDGIFLFMKLAVPYVIIYTITNLRGDRPRHDAAQEIQPAVRG